MKRKGTRKKRLFFTILVVVVVVPVLGEVFLSLVASGVINTQEVDRNIFQAKGIYPDCFGLTPGAAGTAFGTPVIINKEGYRGPLQSGGGPSKILFLGDSILFGVGVPYDRIFSTLVSQTLNKRVVNTGVPSYGTNSYLSVLKYWLKKDKFETVCLYFALDDVVLAGDHVVFASFSKDPFHFLTSWLRSNSRLYMIAKSLLFDRQKTYFEHDASLYREDNPQFKRAVNDLKELKKICDQAGLPFKVFLLPYEYQLRRREDSSVWKPQEMVKQSLASSGIEIHDLRSGFKTSQIPSKNFYLFEDAMHFSERGHRVVARETCTILSPGS